MLTASAGNLDGDEARPGVAQELPRRRTGAFGLAMDLVAAGRSGGECGTVVHRQAAPLHDEGANIRLETLSANLTAPSLNRSAKLLQ